ncbi:SCO family protein [Marinobacter sp.]|uniref:SCO family protein n=1 Tax=Marinobacter sp. TaxID=50741 RepID=UPI003561383B
MTIKQKSSVLMIILLLIAMVTGLPYLQFLFQSKQFYGHYNPKTVMSIPGVKTPASGINLVFFGFGDCTDTCPTQLANLLSIREHLNPDQVGFVYVALDADAQKQDELQKAFRTWNAGFQVFVPDTVKQAQKILRNYGGRAADRGSHFPSSERFSHDGWLYAVNGNSERLIIYGTPALEIALVVEDLTKLLDTNG